MIGSAGVCLYHDSVWTSTICKAPSKKKWGGNGNTDSAGVTWGKRKKTQKASTAKARKVAAPMQTSADNVTRGIKTSSLAQLWCMCILYKSWFNSFYGMIGWKSSVASGIWWQKICLKENSICFMSSWKRLRMHPVDEERRIEDTMTSLQNGCMLTQIHATGQAVFYDVLTEQPIDQKLE